MLHVVKDFMSKLSQGQWTIITANGPSQAFDVLKNQPVELVVVDVQMPVMDGVQMLFLLNRSYPQVLKVAMTALASEQCRTACLRNGADLFLEKPGSSREDWQAMYTALNELLKSRAEKGFQGATGQAGLPELIQMECLSQNSSMLEGSNHQAHGQIFIHEGQIIHAQAGNLSGEEAFSHLLSLTNAQFNSKPLVEPPTRTISGQWEFLLM